MKQFLCLTVLGSLLTLPNSALAQGLVPQVDIPNITKRVQSTDSFRVNELEQEIRRLNGKVEELNFLLLQLQEKFRKMEEDNEGRFQELEEHHSNDSSSDESKSTDLAKADNRGDNRLGKSEPSGELTTPGVKKTPADSNLSTNRAIEPRALGTLTFDKDGNVIDGSGRNPAPDATTDKRTRLSALPGVFNDGTEGGVEASEFGPTPDAVLKVGKRAMGDRKYKRAQKVFNAHMVAWPKDPKAGEVRYFLGEALFWQKDYYESAEIHLDTHNNYPEAETAADNLLALGLSLAGLNQREVACATYAEVLKQYPDAAPRLGERVKDEQAAARC